MNTESLRKDIEDVMADILSKAKLTEGSLFVVGCSSSSIIGKKIGTSEKEETAEAVDIVYEVISRKLEENKIAFAVQCCEHLNRAVVLEKSVAEKYGFEIVNVVPMPHAGGAFAVKHYASLKEPVVVESVDQKADGGLDIGGVMIGMHIHPVVVPLRLEKKHIGDAMILAARRRAKYVGGERAVYNPELA